jgi:tellurite resistance protein TerC
VEIGLQFWIFFNLFVVLMLALDLGVFHRKRREISIKDALVWTVIWIVLAFIFAGIIALWQGKQEAAEFLTGYIIEKALSLDNIFVIALIFTHFKTPPENQHKILFWGIIGALVMRALFIVGGVALLEKFHFTIYIFGVILIYTGARLLLKKHKDIQPEDTWFVRFCLRHLRFTTELHKGNFFIIQNGKRVATPLFLALLVVEATDLMFAVDSIPAILAITQNSFIVYTSNVFAILGLRSLYFALAGIIEKFIYLQHALAIILIFVGCKMMLEDVVKIPIYITLPVVIIIMGISILLSIRKRRSRPELDLPND